MTSKEIRVVRDTGQYGNLELTEEGQRNLMLSEIASQLAEFNETFRSLLSNEDYNPARFRISSDSGSSE